MVDNEPIEEARRLIQGCVEALENEPQQDFLLMRIHTDLCLALQSLAAVQTVVLAPQKGAVPHVYPLGVRPPPVVDLRELDEGDPVSYEVDCEPYGIQVIREADRATLVVGNPPQTFEIPFTPQWGKLERNMEEDDGNEDHSLD